MFVIQQQRSSICLTVLLTALLEFTFVDKSQTICGSNSKRSISYFKLDDKEVNWNEAWILCKNRSSTLPAICNQNEQDALANFLKNNIRSSAAWTSGKKIPFDQPKWRWVDGETFTGGGAIKEQYKDYTHVAIIVDRSYKTQNPSSKTYYLCQYSGSSCNSENDLPVTNGCVRPSDDGRSWYDARNQCLKNGGDLAILKDADLGILRNLSIRRINDSLVSIDSYWIGLRKSTWRLMWQETVPSGGSGEEVRYSNWSKDTHYTGYDCISIDALNGEWKAVGCTDRKKVVCQANHTSSSAASSTSKPTPSRPISESTTQTMNERPSNDDPNVLLYSGAGAGIVIIVICIIVIILAIRYTRKSSKKMNHSKSENNFEQNRRNESPNNPATSPANAPANVPVAEADDSRGLYAEISLATLNQLEDGARTQQPGVVYAALEFQKEPTYLEPDKMRAHTTDQTKVAPVRDIIYAIPDANSHAVASPGNESASHPTKVTPQGDVYALPVKNSKSPTENPPGGNIYANL